ncbi:MAG: hypothetical protein ACW99G_04960 [Candidatus Thorarchaeota archaeon]|jgi:hypothetical protein
MNLTARALNPYPGMTILYKYGNNNGHIVVSRTDDDKVWFYDHWNHRDSNNEVRFRRSTWAVHITDTVTVTGFMDKPSWEV